MYNCRGAGNTIKEIEAEMGNYSINHESDDNLASSYRIVTIFLVFNDQKSQ